MEDYNIKKYRNKIYKIVGITLFTIISLIGLFFFYALVHIDDDKACSIDGGNWNEEKNRCEDQYGNKWKF